MAKYSQDKIKNYIEASDNEENSDIKGDLLERLIVYLFNKIPGIIFHGKNILDGPRAHEIDVVFWNQYRNDLGFLDPIIFIECKNTKNRLGSIDVGWFVRKLQDRGSNNGILVSLNGLTGFQDGTSCAHSEILSSLIRDRIKILVIERPEILLLKTTDDLTNLLVQKYLRLTVNKTIN